MKTVPSAWLMLGLLLGGGALLTAGHRQVQNSTYADVTTEPISDRQRAFVESVTDTSTSLFNLSFAALAGLVGLQIQGKREQRPSGMLPRAAAALLALSMYASFLFRTALATALGRGPVNLLTSAGIDFPLTAQFWLFVGGIVLLLFWVFPGRAAASVVLAAVVVTPTAASAQTPVSSCAAAWQADRHVPLTPDAVSRVEHLVNGIAATAAVALDDTSRCAFVESVLDELRRRVVADGGASVDDPSAALNQAIRQGADTLDSHTFSAGDVVTRLLAMAQVWNGPSGLLVVRSTSDTLFVVATQLAGSPVDWKGITNWTVRLPAGVYRVELLKDGLRVGAPRRIEVASGQTLELAYPEGK